MKLLCLLEKTLSQKPLLVKSVKQVSKCSFLHFTASFKLLFPAHQLTEAESSLIWYARNLGLVLTYCLTFISVGFHFPPPALSSLALVRLNSSREKLLLISMNSFS